MSRLKFTLFIELGALWLASAFFDQNALSLANELSELFSANELLVLWMACCLMKFVADNLFKSIKLLASKRIRRFRIITLLQSGHIGCKLVCFKMQFLQVTWWFSHIKSSISVWCVGIRLQLAQRIFAIQWLFSPHSYAHTYTDKYGQIELERALI